MGMGALLAGLVGRTGELEHEKTARQYEQGKVDRALKIKMIQDGLAESEAGSPERTYWVGQWKDMFGEQQGMKTGGKGQKTAGQNPLIQAVETINLLDSLMGKAKQAGEAPIMPSKLEAFAIPSVPGTASAPGTAPEGVPAAKMLAPTGQAPIESRSPQLEQAQHYKLKLYK